MSEEITPDTPDTPEETEAAEATEEDDGDSSLRLRSIPDDGITRRWYAIHALSGQEGNVKTMLLQGAELKGLDDFVTNVLVPMALVQPPAPESCDLVLGRAGRLQLG